MLYIAFEGIDGTGKSAISHAVTNQLARDGISARRFPFMARLDTKCGRFIWTTFEAEPRSLRGAILEPIESIKLLLFQCNAVENWRVAARSSHVPHIVIGDRSIMSLYASFPNAFGSRAAARAAIRLLTFVQHPTRIIYLDAPPEIVLPRLEARGPLSDTETPAQLATARLRYQEVLAKPRLLGLRCDITRVDATRSFDVVLHEVTRLVQQTLRGGAHRGLIIGDYPCLASSFLFIGTRCSWSTASIACRADFRAVPKLSSWMTRRARRQPK